MNTKRKVALGLDDAYFFVESIAAHWNGWNEFPEDRYAYEHVWVQQFGDQCPGRVLVSLLEPLYRELCEDSLVEYAPVGRVAISSAYHLSGRACVDRLSDADLNRLGWDLTTLVALDIRVSKDILDRARRAGGDASADAARERFSADAAATCEAAGRIISGRKAEGRTLTPADLVRLLVQQGRGTPPTVRAHLRTRDLYPAAKKKKTK